MTPRSEINLKARQEARQFARFLALGGCAALVNWLSRFPLRADLGVPGRRRCGLRDRHGGSLRAVSSFRLSGLAAAFGAPSDILRSCESCRNRPGLGGCNGARLLGLSDDWLRRTADGAARPWDRHWRSHDLKLHRSSSADVQDQLTDKLHSAGFAHSSGSTFELAKADVGDCRS